MAALVSGALALVRCGVRWRERQQSDADASPTTTATTTTATTTPVVTAVRGTTPPPTARAAFIDPATNSILAAVDQRFDTRS